MSKAIYTTAAILTAGFLAALVFSAWPDLLRLWTVTQMASTSENLAPTSDSETSSADYNWLKDLKAAAGEQWNRQQYDAGGDAAYGAGSDGKTEDLTGSEFHPAGLPGEPSINAENNESPISTSSTTPVGSQAPSIDGISPEELASAQEAIETPSPDPIEAVDVPQLPHTTQPATAGIDPPAPTVSQAVAAARNYYRERGRNAAFDGRMDQKMYVGKAYPVTLGVQLPLSGDANLDALRKQLTDTMDAWPGQKVIDEVSLVTDELRAKLIGPAFEISSGENDWKGVAENQPTLWSWTVKPLSSGVKKVYFVVEQRITVGDQSVVLPVDRFPKEVNVDVDTLAFIEAGWVWIRDNVFVTLASVGTLAAGLAALLTLARKKKERETDSGSADERLEEGAKTKAGPKDSKPVGDGEVKPEPEPPASA